MFEYLLNESLETAKVRRKKLQRMIEKAEWKKHLLGLSTEKSV